MTSRATTLAYHLWSIWHQKAHQGVLVGQMDETKTLAGNIAIIADRGIVYGRMDARFKSKFIISGNCWLWQAGTMADGYGSYSLNGKTTRAHRYAYEWAYGLIPTRLVIDHLCRNILCVNFYHLEAVTNGENLKRGINKESAKTHCPKGHPYDAENTHYRPNGWRKCKACWQLDNKRRKTERSERSVVSLGNWLGVRSARSGIICDGLVAQLCGNWGLPTVLDNCAIASC